MKTRLGKTVMISFNFSQEEWKKARKLYSERSIRHILWLGGNVKLGTSLGSRDEEHNESKCQYCGQVKMTFDHVCPTRVKDLVETGVSRGRTKKGVQG